MNPLRWAKLALLAAGSSSCAMAGYHLHLPWEWHWGSSLGSLPPTLRWAIYSMNFFMSYLMLAGGLLTLVAWRRIRCGRPADRGIVAAMGSFWLVNTIYQLTLPMPLPWRLAALRFALVGFAAVVAGAHAVALLALGARFGAALGSRP